MRIKRAEDMGLVVLHVQGRDRFVMQCDCGAKETLGGDAGASETVMIKKTQQSEWRHQRKIFTCPNCLKKEQDVSNQNNATPSIKIISAVTRLLDEVYDESKGRYFEDNNDDTVAESTGASVKAVTAIRIDLFGEMKEAPEVMSLRQDLFAAQDMLTEIQGVVTELMQRLQNISQPRKVA